jgi:hypothetical protein
VEEYFHGEPEKKQELLDELEDWYYSYMEWLEEDEDDDDDDDEE